MEGQLVPVVAKFNEFKTVQLPRRTEADQITESKAD